MTTLKARTIDGSYCLVIETRPLKEIERLCTAAGDNETGGILIGQYTADRLTVVVSEATSPPPDSRKGCSWFVRGIVGLRELLWQRWRSQERQYYVGEWHFHPADIIEPSPDDLDQMARIAREKKYYCSKPILVIIGRPSAGGGGRPLRVFVCPAGETPVEMLHESGATVHRYSLGRIYHD